MADITRYTTRTGSLLSSPNRVEAPFVRVSINGFVFGVYEGKSKAVRSRTGVVNETAVKYPNYIQNLSVKKINGTVNQYSLSIRYTINETSDPNFFEKLLSSVSKTRSINFEYGDAMMPEYVYRNEEAIITKVSNSFQINAATIDYVIEAVSTASLSLSGTYTFPSVTAKPSDIIKKLIRSSKYHLTDVFLGMRDFSLIEQDNFIASDDRIVKIPTCTNMSILEYISLLVSYMNPTGSTNTSALKQNVYSLSTFEDTTGTYGGAYFKVQKIQKASNVLNQLSTYNIDIGYPSANVVESFNVKNNQNWSIFYDYNRELDNSDYLQRIDKNGKIERIYSPQLTNTQFEMNEADSTWWTKVTQYPVEATITIKGLLRPAILMTYVKVNVFYFGRKHIASGYYLITSQEDKIGLDGYKTTLGLLRVAADEEIL